MQVSGKDSTLMFDGMTRSPASSSSGSSDTVEPAAGAKASGEVAEVVDTGPHKVLKIQNDVKK
jgi:hypothetical protein